MFSQQECFKTDYKEFVQNLNLLLEQGQLETVKTILFEKAENERLELPLMDLLTQAHPHMLNIQIYFILGLLHFYKLIPNACNTKAAAYLDEAVKEHHAYACYYRGLLYEAERKIPFAQQMYEIAAAQDNVEAMNTLACLYELAEDFVAAEKLYLLAIQKDYLPAYNNLGWLYEQGYLGKRDYLLAIHYYQKGATRLHENALCNLADIFHHGRPGVPIDIQEAIKLYDCAISCNSATAMVARARMYHKGTGQPISYIKAARLYRQAAQLNNHYAEERLENTKIKEYVYHKFMLKRNMTEVSNLLLLYPQLVEELIDYEFNQTSFSTDNLQDIFELWSLYRANLSEKGCVKQNEMRIRCQLFVALVHQEKNTGSLWEEQSMFCCLLNQSDFSIEQLPDNLLIDLMNALIDKLYTYPSLKEINSLFLSQVTELFIKIFLRMNVCNQLLVLEPYNRLIAQIFLAKLYPELNMNMQSWHRGKLFLLISLLYTPAELRPTLREAMDLFSQYILLNAEQKKMKDEYVSLSKGFFKSINDASQTQNAPDSQSLSAIIK